MRFGSLLRWVSSDGDKENYRLSKERDRLVRAECWTIPIDQLKPVMVNNQLVTLGEGAFGQVFKAFYARESTNCVAVKQFNCSGELTDQTKADFEREAEIMKTISHPNLIRIIGIVRGPQYMLVMELAPHGSLESFLRQLTPSQFGYVNFLRFTQNIASGMEYLEKHQIVHRDLACRNILISSPSTLKISDFGLSQFLQSGETEYEMKTRRYIPISWYAPESLKFNPIFTHKSDVWSFGVTLWEIFMLGSEPNYREIDPLHLYDLLILGKRLAKPNKKVPFTDECWPIMINCWSSDPIKRPNFKKLRKQLDKISSSK